MSDEEEQRRFSVGDALGGWMRRVTDLVAEVSGSPPVPDELKPIIGEAREQRLGGDVAGAIDSVYHGLGFGYVRFTGICEALLVLSFTPIDLEFLDVRFSFSLDARQSGGTTQSGIGAALVQNIVKQWVEDTPVWENKTYLERPTLCENDGPIAEYRRWASQFYDDPSVSSMNSTKTPLGSVT